MSAAAKAEAERRLMKALDHVQRAQEELGRAQTEVSSLIGLLPRWQRLGKVYDQVHAEWYRLEAALRKGKFELDGSALAALERSRPATSPASSSSAEPPAGGAA